MAKKKTMPLGSFAEAKSSSNIHPVVPPMQPMATLNYNAPYLEAMAGWLSMVEIRQQKTHERSMEYMDRADKYLEEMKSYYG